MTQACKSWRRGNKQWARRHGGGRHGRWAKSADRQERAVETAARQRGAREIDAQLLDMEDGEPR